ncbi:MAG: hypothetical protein K9K30_12505 [Burkholderiaceae bacterium]|nr:hypothetical protein [Sulfuritalea sp.]MCF8176052.1 hypothetical protein [Burkholderiaceae bacterium]MCF8183672.1 hypothetical protein [Polynucleobacter sp.]
MNDQDHYRRIAEEIDSGRQDSSVWARALAESGGDADKTKALYIRRRFAALTAGKPTEAADSELGRLRAELRRQLAAQRKQSLYSVIGVPADSSDAAIAEAIDRIKAKSASLDAETRYALEALGDPAAREQFDRRLLEQLSVRKTTPMPAAQLAANETATPLSSALKVLAGVVLVLGIGYLGLGFTKEKSAHEVRIKEIELHKNVVERSVEIADRVVDNQKTAIEASSALREQNAAARESAQLDARMREDKRRLDQAYRQEEYAAQQEQRQQQAEQRRLQMEARRKAAETEAQTRAIRRQAIQDAMARGNFNEAERLRNQQY